MSFRLQDLTNKKILGLQRSIHFESYYDFFKDFWPEISQEDLVENWHLKYLADELQVVGERIINRLPKEYDLVINIPPGTSKTTLCTVLFPVWLWILDASIKVISASYSASLSQNQASLSRDCIASDRFRELHGYRVKIRGDFDNKTHYKTTEGGSRLIGSTGKGVIGEHAHLIIVDDPINPKTSISDVVLEGTNYWFDVTLATRKIDKANTPTILVMQRLHEGDPTGFWLKKRDEHGKEIKHICLPATDEFPIHPKEIASSYVDGLLDPKRMPKQVLKDQRISLGSMGYATQHGQQPVDFEGNMIKVGYLPIVNRLPEKPKMIDFTMDTAYTKDKKNDSSAILAYAVINNDVFLLDYIDVKEEFPDFVETCKGFIPRVGYPNSRVFIEPKATGKSVKQYLKKYTKINVIEYKMPDGDKVARLSGILPFLEANRVYLLKGAWNEGFLSQCFLFPKGSHDEAVDCLSMAATQSLLRQAKKRRHS